MFNKDELDELLVRVGNSVEAPLNIYMIGGCALSFKGLKPATKDIDIIVRKKEDFTLIDKAMSKNGFSSMSKRESDFYLTALAVYMKEEFRIDVFLHQVGKMLSITDSIVKRAQHYKTYGKVSVYLLTNEDIFLFKMMTSREGDIYDCDRIMKETISYDTIYKEIMMQSKEEGKRWFFWVYENLCRLEEHNGIRLPIKSKVFALVKKYWKERPKDFMHEMNNSEKHILEKKTTQRD